jgi:hypothetical protein
MQRSFQGLILLVLGAALTLPAAPEAAAADLDATVKTVRVAKRARLVRDYDGTPVAVRRTSAAVLAPDGTVVVVPRVEMVPVLGATPSRYFNGEPVLPLRPRHSLTLVRRAPPL